MIKLHFYCFGASLYDLQAPVHPSGPSPVTRHSSPPFVDSRRFR